MDTPEELRGDIFIYAIEEASSEVFTDKEFITLTYKFNHFCYEDMQELHDYTLFIYVRAVNGEPITYKQLFLEADKHVNKYFDEIAVKYKRDKYSLVCNHIFLEGFDQVTPIQYDISCGS
jgi:hypothetical protein